MHSLQITLCPVEVISSEWRVSLEMSYGNSAMLKDFKHSIQRMQTRHLIVPCTLGFMLFAILILARSDMWDGTIISYASATGQFHGIRRLTADTDLDSVLILFRFEIFIAKFLHISFLLVDRIVLAAAVVGICSLLHRMVRVQFHLSEQWSAFAMVLFLTFPVWHILASSTQTFYFVLLALGMLGVDLVYRGKRILMLLGFIVLLISFEMNSMLTFAPALALVFEATQQDKRTIPRRLVGPFGITVLGAAYWVTSRGLSQPSGHYANYNVIINPFSVNGWMVIKAGFENYSTFALLPLLGIAVLTCLVTFFGSGDNRVRTPESRSLIPYSALLPLYFASVLPYIVVEKSTLVDDFDWYGRHAIPLSIPVAILTMLSTYCVFQQVEARGWYRMLWKIAVVALLVVPQSYVLMHGLTMKIGRQGFESQLIKALRTEQIKPGIVEIVGLPVFVPDFRVYEANYLMYRTFGEANWWTRIAPAEDPTFAAPDWIQRADYQEMYIYRPPQSACRTIIQVSLTNYGGFWNGAKSVMHLSTNSSVKIASVRSIC